MESEYDFSGRCLHILESLWFDSIALTCESFLVEISRNVCGKRVVLRLLRRMAGKAAVIA
jgi:hypothetical protein